MARKRKWSGLTSVRRGKTERSLEDWCVKQARDLKGWRSRKMNGLGFRDWPDRLFILPSLPKPYGKRCYQKPLWVEFKKDGEEPTENQAILHRWLRSCGEDVVVIDSKEKFMTLLNLVRLPT